jgi:hypothetical protein
MDAEEPHGSNEATITRQCTARSKRSGTRCRKHAMRGRSVCLAHGGRTPRGVDSPHFRHGRYSQALPTRLTDAYERARQDPTLLSLREEAALLTAVINSLLAQLTDDVSAAQERRLWRQIARTIMQRRRLVDAEVRQLVLAREMITAEEAMAMVESIAQIVQRYVPETSDRAAIADEIRSVIDRP